MPRPTAVGLTLTKVYKKDYSKVLACIPLVMAEHIVTRFDAEDNVDTVEYHGNHIFRDELLFLMGIPLQEVLNALTDHKYTRERYSDIYVDMKDDVAEHHFQQLIKPLLLLRMELGL